MAIIPIQGNILEVRFVSQKDEQVAYNVRHYRVSSLGGQGTTLQEIIDALDVKFHADYKALLSIDATYLGMDARRVWSDTTSPRFSNANQGSGDVTGDPLPTQTAGLISLRTDLPGGSGRGRMYVPFPGELDNDASGKPTTSYTGRLADLGDALTDDVIVNVGADSTTLQPVVFDRQLAGWNAITGRVVRAKWATQRRRGSFGRPNVPPF